MKNIFPESAAWLLAVLLFAPAGYSQTTPAPAECAAIPAASPEACLPQRRGHDPHMPETAAGAGMAAADRGIPVQAGWQPAFPEAGPNGRVSAFIEYGDGLVVAGRFSAAGGTAATNIALWDGSTWQALGDGLGGDTNDVVHALAVHDEALIAAGEFRHAGGAAVNHIARWDGHNWSPLGPADTGMDRTVRALAVYQGELVAGGDFGQAGSITAHHIARWNGGSWLPLASGLDAEVEALAVFDGALYAGGLFFWAGNVKATGMARWNGSQWSGIQPDPVTMRRSIFSLLVHEDALYAGGWFTAPGNAVHRVARWDGANWTPLPGLDGPEVPYWVEALAVYRGGLIAGGNIRQADGEVANRIARWDGSQWAALPGPSGTGMDDFVHALAVHDGMVLAGGRFTTAGGLAIPYLARYRDDLFQVGGTVSGLAGSGLLLQLNGADPLTVDADGEFRFGSWLGQGASYLVTVATQPDQPAQACTVGNGSGVIDGTDITSVTVTCLNLYTVTFHDWDGHVLATRTVQHGAAADAPPDPVREGYTFTGWDVDFSHVTSDVSVTALYAINRYPVTAVVTGGEGAVDPPTQTVDHGGHANLIVLAAPGWQVHSVTADGCAVVHDSGDTWRTSPVTAPCQVSAHFQLATVLTAVGGDGQSTTVGTAFTQPLLLRVTNLDGEPLAGIALDLLAPLSGPSAALSSTHVHSNEHGLAWVEATANTRVGSYVVSAHVGGQPEPHAHFALDNLPAQPGLVAGIDNGRDYSRYGEVVNYLVRIDNTGPDPAHDLDLSVLLSDGLDEAMASWLCIGPAQSGCSTQGSGALAETGLALQPGQTLAYLLSVPVRPRPGDSWIQAHLDLVTGSQAESASDRDTLVLLRNGFEPITGDWLHPSAAPICHGPPLTPGQIIGITAADTAAPGIACLWQGRARAGTALLLEQLRIGGRAWLRLRETGPARAPLPAWQPWPGHGSVHLEPVIGKGAGTAVHASWSSGAESGHLPGTMPP